MNYDRSLTITTIWRNNPIWEMSKTSKSIYRFGGELMRCHPNAYTHRDLAYSFHYCICVTNFSHSILTKNYIIRLIYFIAMEKTSWRILRKRHKISSIAHYDVQHHLVMWQAKLCNRNAFVKCFLSLVCMFVVVILLFAGMNSVRSVAS